MAPKPLPIKQVVADVSAWCHWALDVAQERARIETAADSAEYVLRAMVVPIAGDGRLAWQALPLRDRDIETLAALARWEVLPPLTKPDSELLQVMIRDVARSCREANAATGVKRLFVGKAVRASADTSSNYLRDFHAWASSTRVTQRLASMDPRGQDFVSPKLSQATHTSVGLKRRLSAFGEPSQWPIDSFAHLPHSVSAVMEALDLEDSTRHDAMLAGDAVRKAEADRLIAEMPVEHLKQATADRLRTNALRDAGIENVLSVINYKWSLLSIPGIGQATANSMLGAAFTIRQATYDEMPIRLDVSRRTKEAGALLQCLTNWVIVRKVKAARDELANVEALAPLARAIGPDTECLIVFSKVSVIPLQASSASVARFGATAREAVRPAAADPWEAFLSDPAMYFSMLQALGFNAEDEEKVHGELPDEVIEAIRSFELDTRLLSVSLRGYQHFGARFALVQKKVVIGDEMGLGKTIEALAAIAHMAAKGSRHSLVVCPAAVVTNWMREVQSRTKLPAHRLHGTDRRSGFRSWTRGGGVAVTTYESLNWLQAERGGVDVDIACAVFDEAHYIKNPTAQRSMMSARLIEGAERAVLLTGTPLENRVEEFRNLISYLRPDLTVDASEFAPRRFRQQVAPAYLRRNQEDVLGELPELVEVDEWLDLSEADDAAYRNAVRVGSFHDMRQAAMLQGQQSAKVQRLIEIVDEAEQNGRRVLVFSHYRQVLEQVCRVLPGLVIGPLTGSVAAVRRQQMVDEFSEAGDGAVLVAQIQAGGVGLNIQSASVVVICEPQLKPTIEWQAIARAHRMGQPQSVQVHRLLTDPGIDIRVRAILARKAAIFDEFARVSDMATSAPEAVDISEAELVREVVAEERKRLFPGTAPADQ